MPINTKQVARRPLAFASLADISAELDRIEAAHKAGRLKANGNWTPAQILDHLAITFGLSLDGFPPDAKPPAILKWIVITFFKKKAVSGATAPAGIPFPKGVDIFTPSATISFDDALAKLRRMIARATTGGERMDKPSPLLGPMTHEQWTGLHRGHCASHLGFLDPGR